MILLEKGFISSKEVFFTPLTGGVQAHIDQLMLDLDGTKNKKELGANAILGVSMAVARTSAKALNLPLFNYLSDGKADLLPLPEIQLIGGGAHAGGRIDIQDFMIICTGAESYH